MTLLSRRFKLEYNDAADGTTVIAETGQDTGALKIDRHQHIRRKKDPNILKLWLEGSNFGESIPTRKSEFGTAQNGTDEPEILLKQYDPDTDSFVTQGRFYAKNTGTINQDGELALKLYSFLKFTGRQSVNTGTTTTDIADALQTVLPSGYVVDVPAGATPPTVDGYSINSRREKGYFELTTDYKWTLTFTSELDANNDYKVKFEPEGFGGTVDTIIENTQASRYPIVDVDAGNDTFTVNGDVTNELVVNQAILVNGSTGNDGTYTINNLTFNASPNTTTISVDENVTSSTVDGEIIPGGQAVFKSWEKDKTDSIINKVTVEGTNGSGAKITGTATNQTQIDNFGEKFLKVKRGYLASTSDAENIAEGYLVPGLDENGDDITKVPENGTVKTTAYSDNVVNDSFQVVGNKRNIDDTYTVVQQRNYWPEGATELEFEFEQENLEQAARDSENLRDERSRLYPTSNKSLQGQTGEDDPVDSGLIGENDPANSGLIGENDPTTSGQVGENDPLVTGTTEAENLNFNNYFDETRTGINISNSGYTLVSTAASGTVNQSDLYHRIFVRVGDFSDDGSASDPGSLYVLVTGDSDADQVIYIQESIDTRPFTAVTGGLQSVNYYVKDFVIPAQNYADGYRLYLGGANTGPVDLRFTVEGLDHTHDATTLTADLHPHNADTGTDASTTVQVDLHPHDADDVSSTLTTDLHPHDADDGSSTLQTDLHPHPAGTLEASVAEEDKTDR